MSGSKTGYTGTGQRQHLTQSHWTADGQLSLLTVTVMLVRLTMTGQVETGQPGKESRLGADPKQEVAADPRHLTFEAQAEVQQHLIVGLQVQQAWIHLLKAARRMSGAALHLPPLSRSALLCWTDKSLIC